MRIGYLIVAVLAIIAYCFCYRIGYRAGTKESLLREEREGNLLLALRTYQAMERTNWTKAQSAVGMQVLALTRDYEQRFGAPTGTNRFVQHFADAQAAAKRIEQGLVRLDRDFINALNKTNALTK